jgi:hypothetical protein
MNQKTVTAIGKTAARWVVLIGSSLHPVIPSQNWGGDWITWAEYLFP